MFGYLYRLCVDNAYFTCGTSQQYERMFDMVRQGASAHDLAVVIWLCSENAEQDVIEQKVKEIFAQCV